MITDAPGKRLAGSDAARFTHVFGAAQLLQVCSLLLSASTETGYRERFAWSDHITEVTDLGEIARLDEETLRALLDGQVGGFDLYPAEMGEEPVVDFGTDTHTTVMEPSRELLGATLRRTVAGDRDTLARWLRTAHYITARDDEGVPVGRWSWCECLYYEGRLARRVTALDRGVWWLIKRDLAKAVNDFAAALPASDLALPYALRTDAEGDYNEPVALEREGIRLPARRLVAAIPGESRLAIYDLFCGRGHLVQVKRRTAGSSRLSHLFAQALVSSQLLVGAPQFVAAMREQLTDWGGLVTDPFAAPEHPVVFGLLLAAESSGRGARALPFFAKIALRLTAQQIKAMGFPLFFMRSRRP